MLKKYQWNTEENKAFLKENAEALLSFGHRYPSPEGSAYYLGDDGTPWMDRPRETWITSRMVHVYSLGTFLSHPGSRELADAGLRGLLGELKDRNAGGWYAGVAPDGHPLDGKQCYAHAFVILAACSAHLAKRPMAEELLSEALNVYDRYFWDEEAGLSRDTWDTGFTACEAYRGLNSNMHTVEAFLAAADTLKNREYFVRSGRIIDRVIRWAKENRYRIPEHFSSDWEADLEFNREKPDDPFKPYGATPGHGIEWARLIVQWAFSEFAEDDKRESCLDAAEKLYQRAIEDAWEADGGRGLVYTTDWDGKPVVHDRMHWTLAEAINTASVLLRVTKKERYAGDYSRFLQYLDEVVVDHGTGSWFHQLDQDGRVLTTVWPGKSDLYHALQAMLIPMNENTGCSIAKALADQA